SSPSSTNFDITLYTFTPTHPYTYLDPSNHALVVTNIPVVTAQNFRAEFVQWNAGRGYDGPRIHELDGFGPATPPTITSQPQSQTVVVGGSATFNVTVSGAAPLSFQWTHAGTNL